MTVTDSERLKRQTKRIEKLQKWVDGLVSRNHQIDVQTLNHRLKQIIKISLDDNAN